MAWSRFHSLGSIAMTLRAPEMTAPCSALMPMPPTPTITTVSPGCTWATLVAEPKPVGEVKLIPPMSATGVGAFWFNPSIADQCFNRSEYVYRLAVQNAETASGQWGRLATHNEPTP